MEERRHATERERTIVQAPEQEPDVESEDWAFAGAATAYDEATDGSGAALGDAGVLALQETAGNEAVGSLLGARAANPVVPALMEPGSPLDGGIRSEMEAQFGADFGSVRVHAGAASARSAADLSAAAYTTGEDIVLGSGIDAASDAGRATIAHELTHVVQQREGPVAGTERGDGVSVSDPSDSFEQAAAATARQIVAPRADGGGDQG